MGKICVKFIVKGGVQGVFYRDSCKKEADKLAITGWVRNRQNHEVEVLACGTAAQIAQLESWLWRGPMLARVTDVTSQRANLSELDSFDIRQ